MTSTQPSSQLIAATKGIAIAASFITTGSLLTNTNALIPSILHSSNADESSSAQTAAQQFALGYRAGSKTLPPAEILATATFGFLAYNSRQSVFSPSTWKLYAGAAAAMFSVVPYTVFLMHETTLKLVQLADAAKSLIKCNILVEHFLHYAPSACSHNITVVVVNYVLHHWRQCQRQRRL